MTDIKTQQREWLAALVETTGRSLTAIARKSGVHDSTLTRFMNNQDVQHALSARTIGLIERAMGVTFGKQPETLIDTINAMQNRPKSAWDLQDVVPIDLAMINHNPLSSALSGIGEDIEAWTLRTDALTLAGARSGDILVIDRTIAPADGDIVLVSLGSHWNETARFTARLYMAPFLMTATMPEHTVKPQLVDNLSATIVGVATLLLRARGFF